MKVYAQLNPDLSNVFGPDDLVFFALPAKPPGAAISGQGHQTRLRQGLAA
ncbi:MAG: hypothetical protein IPL59_00565 [Candidatus Competibacteraceae bacterium]|nr:hypothetical protein [Candidatus Competibacteraceae bacterium]